MTNRRDVATVTTATYLAFLRRRRAAVLCGVLAGLVGAAVYATVMPPVYRAAAQVLILPADSHAATTATGRVINLDDAAQLVTSAAVVDAVAKKLHEADTAGLARAVDVTVPPNTTVLSLGFRAADPEQARKGAEAFAEAYLAERRAQAASDLSARRAELQRQHDDLEQQLSALVGSGSGNDTALTVLTRRLRSVSKDTAETSAITVVAGRIVRTAALPSRPVAAVLPRLVSGGALGLLAGLLLGLARDRADGFVRDIDRLEWSLPVPVPVLRLRGSRNDTELSRRLANALLDAAGPTGRSILVLTATPEASRVTSAAARSLAALGRHVHLVLGGDAATAEQRELEDAAPELSVSRGRGEHLATALAEATGTGALVVAELPLGRRLPAAAQLFDVVVVVVDLGRTRHDALGQALMQLRQGGADRLRLLARLPAQPQRRGLRRSPAGGIA